MANRKSFFKALKSYFGITQKKISGKEDPVPFPGDQETRKSGGKGLKPAKFDDELLRLYNFFLNDTYDTAATLKDRQERYDSLQYAYYNSPIISATIDLYADEATQIDSQSKLVDVEAKDSKVQKWIQEFFDDVGINQKILRDVAWNITLFGDAFWILSSSPERGINEVVPVDVFSVKDRLEFNAAEVSKKMNQKRFASFVNRNSNVQAIRKMMDNETDDFSKYFKNYLFGYQVENHMLPPWNVAHFRAFTTQSEFHPFGRPVLINSLAPFRQLQAVKNLMALGRANSFNLKHFQVKTDENATSEDKWEAVNEAKQQYNNLGNDPSGKEQFTVNSELWTPQDLLSVESIESRFDSEKVADVELLRDDLIMGTRIPKGYLIVDKSSFGTSGQALLAQHKPFARAVYSIQTAILEQLAQIVRVQMLMTGKFDPDETEFELRMAFPETEESSDRINVKSDLLRLTKDIVDNVGEALGLGRDEALPPEVIKQIFSQFSFLDGEDIDSWVDAVVAAREEEGDEEEESKGGGGLYNQRTIKGERLSVIRERLGDNPNVINECYYDALRKNDMKEGVMNQRHFYTSTNIDNTDRQVLKALETPARKLKE